MMTIAQMLSAHPARVQKLIQALERAGIHCLSCGAQLDSTVEEEMQRHGKGEAATQALLAELNDIIAAPLELSTITMTECAAEKFHAMRVQEGCADAALLLGVEPGGCSGFRYTLEFSFGEEEATTTFPCPGGMQLVVRNEHLNYLLGCEIDYVEGLTGSGFKISNPNVRSSCGCGNSQSF